MENIRIGLPARTRRLAPLWGHRRSGRVLSAAESAPHIVPPPRAERARSLHSVRTSSHVASARVPSRAESALRVVPPPRVERARSVEPVGPSPLVRAPWAASAEAGAWRSALAARGSEAVPIDATPVLGSRRERREAERRLAERGLVLPVA